jgi:hypothetical protein
MPAPVAAAFLGAAVRVGVAAARGSASHQIRLTFRRRALFRIAMKIGEKAIRLSREVRVAERKSAENAIEIARELSSGRFSSAQLRRMGHPYRLSGTSPQDAAIMNRQSGQFYRGWRIIAPRKAGDEIRTSLVNDSPHARLLLRGTSRMIARPILTRIRERAEPGRRALYRLAIRRTLTR